MGAYLKALAPVNRLSGHENIPDWTKIGPEVAQNVILSYGQIQGPNVKNQRGWRGGFFAGSRLCLRMVNRKK